MTRTRPIHRYSSRSQQIALKQTLDSPVPGISAGVHSSLNIDGACWLQYPNDAILPAANQEVERILV
jgi:hypothetical protein